MAALYVVLSIASRILDRVVSPDAPLGMLDAVHWAVGLGGVLVPLVVAQRVANLACEDPEGVTNSKMTFTNFVFLGLGVPFGLAIAASFLLPPNDPSSSPGEGNW